MRENEWALYHLHAIFWIKKNTKPLNKTNLNSKSDFLNLFYNKWLKIAIQQVNDPKLTNINRIYQGWKTMKLAHIK